MVAEALADEVHWLCSLCGSEVRTLAQAPAGLAAAEAGTVAVAGGTEGAAAVAAAEQRGGRGLFLLLLRPFSCGNGVRMTQ